MRLLLVEFNEIDSGLIERGISRGELPVFARLHRGAARYITDTAETLLEPWVQWVTLHTGVPLAEHGAVQLAQGHRVTQPFVWETLAAAGHDSWVCGAMNARETPALPGRVLPDYWTLPGPHSPFLPFSRFVNACVSRQAGERHQLPLFAALRFLAFMTRHGLRPTTLTHAARQLAVAFLTRSPWRLVFVLERCQLDLFLHESERLRPELGVFFANSVAHLQHNYWRPEEASDAVAEGYRHLDVVLGRLLAAVGDETTVLLCSALGQRPYRPSQERGALVYRVKDLEQLVRALELPPPQRIIRTMADSFTLEYAEPRAGAEARRRLRAVTIGARPLFVVGESDGADVLVEVALTHAESEDQPLTWDGRSRPVTLGEILQVGHRKSGEHHPQGLLWVRGSFPCITPDRPVPLTAIAPSIERFFGLARRRGSQGEIDPSSQQFHPSSPL